MSRLIDADKCPCILCEDTRNAHCTYEHRSCEKFCNWLNNTAYDVEKVVAELEEATQFVDLSNPTSPIRHKVSAIHPSVAIEIARKGGTT